MFWPDQPEFVRMAAKFGTTIVPFGVVGEDDIAEVSTAFVSFSWSPPKDPDSLVYALTNLLLAIEIVPVFYTYILYTYPRNVSEVLNNSFLFLLSSITYL